MFLVVETVNNKGEKEWKVAPKRWVCTTKNTRRTVLLWPNEISSERQKQLVRDGSSKPMKSWSRMECIVKKGCPTYDGANTAMQGLLRPRSKLSVTIPMLSSTPVVQSGQIIKQENEDPLNIDNPDEVPTEPPTETLLQPKGSLSMMVSIKSMVQSLMAKHEEIVKQNARIEKQNACIVEQNTNIIERNKRIEKTNAALLTKIDSIQKALQNVDSQQCYANTDIIKTPSYSFKPMETIDQLKRLDEKLNDTSYRSKLLTWLALNVTGYTTHSKMSSCMDLLLTRELATKCTWTGRFRDRAANVAIRDHRNIVNLFKAIGTSPHHRIDDWYVHKFFQKKLKNARQRLRDQEHSVSNEGSNPIGNNEQQAGCEGIAITYADSSNAIDHLSMESLDDESYLVFEAEVLN